VAILTAQIIVKGGIVQLILNAVVTSNTTYVVSSERNIHKGVLSCEQRENIRACEENKRCNSHKYECECDCLPHYSPFTSF